MTLRKDTHNWRIFPNDKSARTSVVLRNRLFNVPDLENVRGPVSAVDGGFHVRLEAPAALACSFHR